MPQGVRAPRNPEDQWSQEDIECFWIRAFIIGDHCTKR